MDRAIQTYRGGLGVRVGDAFTTITIGYGEKAPLGNLRDCMVKKNKGCSFLRSQLGRNGMLRKP